MVGKRKVMLTRSRSTPADLKSARRPKRNVSPKNLHDDTSGLSWREERELKKALYASLQEARRHSREDQTDDSTEASRCSAPDLSDCHGNKTSQSRNGDFNSKDPMAKDNRKGLAFSSSDVKKQKIQAQRKFALSSLPLVSSETLRKESFQKKIHAQRKFAQGSLPSTPQETPSKPKFKVSPVKLFPQRPKTEDFLTYLCFRGTSLLPPHLDLMNIQREEAGETSHPGTPSTNGRAGFTRESSPASSSTSHSHNNEDSLDGSALTSRSQTPNRKAARASASTPETARGFAGLRANMMRNKSPRLCSPLSSRGQQGSHSQVRRTRYSDTLIQAKLMKIKKSKQGKSPDKRSVNDRMSLKRKAMATLAAAKSAPKKKDTTQRPGLRHSESDSVLLTKQRPVCSESSALSKVKVIKNCCPDAPLTETMSASHCDDVNETDTHDQDGYIVSNHDWSCDIGSQLELSYTHLEMEDSGFVAGLVDESSLSTLADVTTPGKNTVFVDNMILDHGHEHSFPSDNRNMEVKTVPDICLASDGKKRSTSTASLVDSLLQPIFSDTDDSFELPDDNDISMTDSLDIDRILCVSPGLNPSSKSVQNPSSHEGDAEDRTQRRYQEVSLFLQHHERDHNNGEHCQRTVDGSVTLNHAGFVKIDKTRCEVTECTPNNKSIFVSSTAVSGRRSSLRSATASYPRRSVKQDVAVDNHLDQGLTNTELNLTSGCVVNEDEEQSRSLCDHNYYRKSTPIIGRVKSSRKVRKRGLKKSSRRHIPLSGQNEKRRSALMKNKDDFSRKPERSSQGQSSRSQTDASRKRKSVSTLQDKQNSSSESKKGKIIGTRQRVKYLLRIKSKTSGSTKPKRKFSEMETHPNKRLSTAAPRVPLVSKKGPVTRASSHFKAALTTAKRVAARKLKEIKKVTKARRDVAAEKEGKSSSGAKDSSKGDNQASKRNENGIENKVCLDPASDRLLKDQIMQVQTIPDQDQPAAVLQCPTYFPTDEQFKDPISYIQTIKDEAEPFGMCRIIPPSSWKMESRMIDDMRFVSQIQHIHRLHNRTGPCADRLECIKRHFESTGTDKFQHPQIGGVELDLVKLYDIVCKYGGMQRIVDKKKWLKVADAMKISKQSQDRVKKMYSAYCKYLLSYETLAEEEREKIEQAVLSDRQRRENSKSSSSADKCVYRGRSQPLCAYSRAARNIQTMYGQEGEVTTEQVEDDYWKILDDRSSHVAVQGASLDTSVYGSMFAVKRDNPYSRHPWNLHNLVQSKGSVLNHLGLIADVTVPTLHVRMLYTTSCLSANVHNLAQVHYHHQGDPVVWYAVPGNQHEKLKSVLQEIVPDRIRDKDRLLSTDCVMIPPEDLVEKGISVSQCVQSIRQFVVIFPSIHHANISTGYSLAESVHYATQDWIPDGCQAAEDLSRNQEAEQFSMDAMLVFLGQDPNTPESTLSLVLPHLEKVVDREITERQTLSEAGLKMGDRLPNTICKTPSRASDVIEEINICDVSNKICYLSMVLNDTENSAFCLQQGILHVAKKRNLKNCKLMYRYTEEELKNLVQDVRARLQGNTNSSLSSPKKKSNRKNDGKVSPQNGK